MNKKFDCVKMTREIRDNLYNKNKDKSLEEFADMLAQEARKSPLWQGLKVTVNSNGKK